MLKKLISTKANVLPAMAGIMAVMGVLAIVQFVKTAFDGTLKEQGKKIACAHRGDCK